MRKSLLLRMVICCSVALLAAGGLSRAEEICFQCHDRQAFLGKVIHQPVAESRCSLCHNPHVAKHSKLLKEREDTLCFSCHSKSEKQFNVNVVHAPVKEGKCSVCHAPHVSADQMLIVKNLSTGCLQCHEKLEVDFEYTHEPFAKGNCGVCHEPHNADNVQLLAEEPDKLCFSCHKTEIMQQKHKDYPQEVKSCLTCHNPHGSDREQLVRNFLHQPYVENCTSCHQDGGTVSMDKCLGCHQETGKDIQASHSHISLQDGNSCLNCHSPHAGDDEMLLKAKEEQICRTCHGDVIEMYKNSPSRHPPVKNCSSCHESHGSNNLALIKTDGNEICIQCHKTQGNFTHPVGPEVLNSLNGQEITCISCHNPMGTDHKYHLVLDRKKDLCVLCHRSY